MAHRRANGEGTIYRRKDRRYEAAAFLPTTSGVRKRLRVYGRTREEVHAKLIEAKAKAQAGIPTSDKQIRLNDYLDCWLADVVKPNKRPATYAQCEQTVRLYLKPGLGSRLVAQITVREAQGFLNEKLSQGHSIPTVQVIRKVLSSALTCAMRDELIGRNVARLVQLPKHEPAEVRPWSTGEIRRFLDIAETHELYLAFLLLGLYGMRRGEVLGLSWQDVDFAQNLLHVRQQLQRAEGGLQLGLLKSKASKRDLPLLGMVRDALLARHTRQAGYKDDGLIFTAKDGSPLEASTLVRAFKRICLGNDLRLIRIHDMRHSLTTLLKDMQVPVRDAQLILGHARISTTQEVYEHGNVELQRQALGRIEKLFIRTSAKTRSRSRQFSRQGWLRDELFTTINFGAGEGTLTPGLILGKSNQLIICDRLSEVQSAVKLAERKWLLGAVAVNLTGRLRQFPLGRVALRLTATGHYSSPAFHGVTS